MNILKITIMLLMISIYMYTLIKIVVINNNIKLSELKNFKKLNKNQFADIIFYIFFFIITYKKIDSVLTQLKKIQKKQKEQDEVLNNILKQGKKNQKKINEKLGEIENDARYACYR